MEKDWHPVFPGDPSLYDIHYLNDMHFGYPSLTEMPNLRCQLTSQGRKKLPNQEVNKESWKITDDRFLHSLTQVNL